jgi:hypothetical protein
LDGYLGFKTKLVPDTPTPISLGSTEDCHSSCEALLFMDGPSIWINKSGWFEPAGRIEQCSFAACSPELIALG